MNTRPRQNVEIKARVASLPSVRNLVESVATKYLGTFQQTDTFFHTPSGRLKVREVPGRSAELIAYHRPDTQAAKSSHYHLVAVDDGTGLVAALSDTLGVRAVVRKTREVFLYHNVRIHLDSVDGLGEFVELESVVSEDVDEFSARRRLDEVADKLGLSVNDFVSHAYADLLGATGTASQ